MESGAFQINIEASKVLAEALTQMDGIIAGIDSDLTEISAEPMAKINSLLNELGEALNLCETNNNAQLCKVDPETITRILSWLTSTDSNGTQFATKELQEKVFQLENEKQALLAEIEQLTEQVSTQKERIVNLEGALSDVKLQLDSTENTLQEVIASRSCLEDTNLRVLAEISKLKQSSKLQNPERNEVTVLNEQLVSLKRTILERETEIGALRLSLAKWVRNSGYPLTETEYQLLKEKSMSSESISSKKTEEKISVKPPVAPRPALGTYVESVQRRNSDVNQNIVSQLRSPHFSSRGRSESPMTRQANSDNVDGQAFKNPPQHYNTMPRLHGAQSLKAYAVDSNDATSGKVPNSQKYTPPSAKSPLATSGHLNKHLKTSPNNISTRITQKSNPDLTKSSLVNPELEFPKDKGGKGFKKIFEKMKKSGTSSHLQREFTRGGFRATTGSRPDGAVNQRRLQNINSPFPEWDTILIADWLAVVGLGMYSNACKKWVRSGEQLLKSTAHELEKHMGMKNGLHRKKLKLSLSVVNNDCSDLTKCASQLDYLWVAKWLDDIGLPQYKETFLEARVDGAVLHHLTVEDLVNLKVTTHLHYLALQKGIEVLREHRFSPHSLIKRATEDELNSTEWLPVEVSRWSCVRVMDWLRSIDLPEYAPNLVGTGTTGALIIREPYFTSDVLSTLLNIPLSKTLLRRHIANQFKQLIGHQLSSEKRELETQQGFTPLSPSAKLKAFRGSNFSIIRRRGKTTLSYDDFVCPLTEVDNDKSSVESNV